ncbi:hypothetical protein [Nonlabens sp.]|uniref:hypothetical protein n=1 Tax=Nonlabens sp. TaxID=1888209 RepID=UPI003F69BE2F
MSSFSFKKRFENKSSVVTYDEQENMFLIDDNAKSQVWLLNIIMFCNFIIMTVFYLKSDKDGFAFFFLVFGILCLVVFFLSLYKGTAIPQINKDNIKEVNAKVSRNSIVIKLKNGKRRNLYLFQRPAAQVIVDLFKEKQVTVLEN